MPLNTVPSSLFSIQKPFLSPFESRSPIKFCILKKDCVEDDCSVKYSSCPENRFSSALLFLFLKTYASFAFIVAFKVSSFFPL